MSPSDWKRFEVEPFQVFPTFPKRPVPIRIRPFTSESYNGIKKRERQKSAKRSDVRYGAMDNESQRLHRVEPTFEVSRSELLTLFDGDSSRLSSFLGRRMIPAHKQHRSTQAVNLEEGTQNSRASLVDFESAFTGADDTADEACTLSRPTSMLSNSKSTPSPSPPPAYEDSVPAGLPEKLSPRQNADSSARCALHSVTTGAAEEAEGHSSVRTVDDGMDITASNVDSRLDSTTDMDQQFNNLQTVRRKSWSHEEDEHLLHLRDIAGLPWGSIYPYFEGAIPNAVRNRYYQLRRRKARGQHSGLSLKQAELVSGEPALAQQERRPRLVLKVRAPPEVNTSRKQVHQKNSGPEFQLNEPLRTPDDREIVTPLHIQQNVRRRLTLKVRPPPATGPSRTSARYKNARRRAPRQRRY